MSMSLVPPNQGEYQTRIRPSAFGVDLVGTEKHHVKVIVLMKAPK